MDKNYLHISLCIDESGSMFSSRDDVIGGVKSLIEEQRKNKDGKVTLSLYTFGNDAREVFIGKDIINEDFEFEYHPDGMTAMNDGIALAISNTGKWLADMEEDERPGKVLVAVFTDGLENNSKEHTLSDVKKMIEHQESKYNWTFIYMGCDITNSKAADELGFKYRTYGSRKNLFNNYDIINAATSAYRVMASSAMATMDSLDLEFTSTLQEASLKNTKEYEDELGKKID